MTDTTVRVVVTLSAIVFLALLVAVAAVAR
jgi:hypothetical protein